ncbi:hypothetical protein CC78DRAFT_531488 [Lojkania enalia]|uniref:Uncharacterized protein n=1 Tax=Lojkania enalia TaxID=147567 RepID=A0A9P4KDL1_9PLEO|nr:hypothetical protein CC78DRAFT_531488 [Didymosphaeria enalia]
MAHQLKGSIRPNNDYQKNWRAGHAPQHVTFVHAMWLSSEASLWHTGPIGNTYADDAIAEEGIAKAIRPLRKTACQHAAMPEAACSCRRMYRARRQSLRAPR